MITKIQKIISTEFGNEAKLVSLDKLHGDASYRIYYRAKLADGTSYIVMQLPQGKASASEEITNFKVKLDTHPFIDVDRYLASLGVNVPKVFTYNTDERIMILEDLGDNILGNILEKANDATRIDWYKKAIELLCFIQKKTREDKKHDCVVFKRSFDATLLNWEFDHFLEYLIEAKLGIKLSSADAKVFKCETRAITDKISSLSYGFTHRDFQSRNMLIKDGKIYLIDFQDALLGPSVYDLVSLLRDSYVSLSDDTVKTLIEHYAKLSGRSFSDVSHEFHLVTVQRKMKDAGRFVYIEKVKGNPNYLKFIPTSLGYVRNALENLAEHKKLKELFFSLVSQL